MRPWAGFVERHPDPADRRRTIVQITPAQSALIGQWLDGAASPLARVLDKLDVSEQAAFVKAMDLLEIQLRRITRDRTRALLFLPYETQVTNDFADPVA